MELAGNTILITGGGTGIGLALAEAFVQAGSQVIICGRRADKLVEAQQRIPGLHTLVADVAQPAERERLFTQVRGQFPAVNMLINNAGIQRELDFASGAAEALAAESEIETNLTACVHLAALFVPHFLQQQRPCAVVNVTSGLAFLPLKIVPVYCATKAALHAFSVALRGQLLGTNVRVVEVIPPIVQTELHREAKARKSAQRGIAPARVAAATLRGLRRDRTEIPVGDTGALMMAARIAPGFFGRLLNRVAAG